MAGVTVAPKTNNLNVGDTRQLNATVEPSDADNQGVAFASNDDGIATVDSNGVVTAIAEGTATITVKTDDGGHEDTATVNVAGTVEPVDPEEPEG